MLQAFLFGPAMFALFYVLGEFGLRVTPLDVLAALVLLVIAYRDYNGRD